MAKDIWQSLLIPHQGNGQVKDNKIDLLVQQYQQFTILEEESVDSSFSRFNTIITSLKALDEDFSSLALDELIGNLKVHEVVMGKDSEIYKGTKERFFRRKGRFVRQPQEEKKPFRRRDDKKGKKDRKCFRCGDLNHLIDECLKPPRNKDQKAFVGGSWRDSENEVEDETNDETCLMAQ
ncbi:zf-CCHC domain-containing protein [Tanacetum coccineum]